MSVAGHVSPRMLAPCSHVRLENGGRLWRRSLAGVQGVVMAQSMSQKMKRRGMCLPTSLIRLAGPTRLELATSCVTDKKHAPPNQPEFNSPSEIKGFMVVSSMCVDGSGCCRMIIGSPQKSPHSQRRNEEQVRSKIGAFAGSTGRNLLSFCCIL